MYDYYRGFYFNSYYVDSFHKKKNSRLQILDLTIVRIDISLNGTTVSQALKKYLSI